MNQDLPYLLGNNNEPGFAIFIGGGCHNECWLFPSAKQNYDNGSLSFTTIMHCTHFLHASTLLQNTIK